MSFTAVQLGGSEVVGVVGTVVLGSVLVGVVGPVVVVSVGSVVVGAVVVGAGVEGEVVVGTALVEVVGLTVGAVESLEELEPDSGADGEAGAEGLGAQS